MSRRLSSRARSSSSSSGSSRRSRYSRLRGESLEGRSLLAADITFAANILTINITGAGETVDLNVTGTTLNVTSSVNTTADPGAVGLGFTAGPTGPGTNSGSIAAGVHGIVINGAAGIQTINFNGGIFTAVAAGTLFDLENINFAVAGSTFSRIDAGAPDAHVNARSQTSFTQAAAAPIDTTDGGDITLGSANGNITFNGTITATGGGKIDLRASNNGDMTIGAAVTTTGGNGGILLLAEDILTLNAALSTSGTGTIALGADSTNTSTGFFSSSAGGTINTAGGDVTIIAQDIDLGAAINATAAGDVNLAPRTPGDAIDLGTDGVALNDFGLTAADLDLITAGIIRVGAAGAGAITVTEDISPALSATLSLITGGGITQQAGDTITVANLAMDTALTVLLPFGIEVTNLAVAIATGGEDMFVADVTGFNIDNIDGVVGINTIGPFDVVTLSVGGAVTQSAGATVFATSFEVLGAGPATLNDPNNDVDNLSANLTTAGAGFSFVDADDVTINIVSLAVNAGITTNGGNITVTTVNGILTVLNGDAAASPDVDAGTGTVALTAGSVGAVDNLLNIQANAGVTGTGGVTLRADNMSIFAAVNAGTNTATLHPFQPGTLISLGGVDFANVLGLNDLELDLITAGVVVVGDSTAGDIDVTLSIDPANTNQLELVTNGSIDAAANQSITVARLGLTAQTGIGVTNDLDTDVDNLEAVSATGIINIDNTGPLVIGGVNAALSGVDSTTSGDIFILSSGTIDILTEPIIGTGNVTVDGTVAAADIRTGGGLAPAVRAGGIATLDAGRDVLVGFGTFGDIDADAGLVLTAGRDVVIDNGTFVTVKDSGATAAVTAGRDVTLTSSFILTNSGAITVQAGAGGVVTVGTSFKLDSTANASAGADITISADDMVITGDIEAGAGIATLQQASAVLQDIDLGTNSAGNLGLTDAEINLVIAARIRIGRLDNAGNISITSAISTTSSLLLHLRTAGAIIDGTAAEATDITVDNLALEASLGIGSGNDIDVSVDNLAAANLTVGHILITSVGATTVASIDGVAGANNSAPGFTLAITAASPLTIAANSSSVGNVILTAAASAAAGDDLTVNSGVTVQSTTGFVALAAGDIVQLPLGSTVNAFGALTITGGFGEVDGGGGVNLLGAVSGSSVSVSGGTGADTFNINPTSGPALISVSGLSGNDAFNVTPNTATAFFIDGGPPVSPTFPGDTLTVDFTGTTGATFTPGGPGDGTFTFTNRQQIDFVSIETIIGPDFGDAPDTYGTLAGSGGPNHTLGSPLRLGAAADFELDGQPSADALGDDTDADGDDEDGVTLPGTLIAGLSATVTVNVTGTGGFLNAWIDFNASGTFDVGEQIATSLPVVPGNNAVIFAVPTLGTVDGPTFARFRLSTTAVLGSGGFAADGEVEDYATDVTVVPPGTAGVFPDPNNPGQFILVASGGNGNDTILIDPLFAFNYRVKINGKTVLVVPNDQFQTMAVLGLGGNDKIVINSGFAKVASLFGGPGNDRLHGARAADQIFGGPGNDTLYGEKGADTILGEEGNDTVYGGDDNDLIDGGDNNDKLNGGNGNDTIRGGEGNDTAHGDAGNDLVFGGNGNDSVYGDSGNDVVLGDGGNDRVSGGTGRDLLIGGGDKDSLLGDGGDDILIGGTTVHDGDTTALLAIIAEWSSGLSYNQRVTDLKTAGGFNLISGVDVFGDGLGFVNTLKGQSNLDWFHDPDGEDILDKTAAEILN